MGSDDNQVKDPVVLNFHESCLRQSDVETLFGENWLRDNIISFFFEYLERVAFKEYTNWLFISPQVTQCIKISNEKDETAVFLNPLDFNKRDFVFFALNDNETAREGGTHWSLVVYSKPEKKLFHFDSSEGVNHDQAWELGVKIIKYLSDESIEFEEASCLQQTNGYDCGLHLICNAENVAQYIIEKNKVSGVEYADYEGVVNKRSEILNLIQDLQSQGFD